MSANALQDFRNNCLEQARLYFLIYFACIEAGDSDEERLEVLRLAVSWCDLADTALPATQQPPLF